MLHFLRTMLRNRLLVECPQCKRWVLRWGVSPEGWCQHCAQAFDLRHELSDY